MSVDKAAKNLISGKTVSEGLLNMVEMAFRAYDPCLGCATHASSNSASPSIRVLDANGEVVGTDTHRRDAETQR
jgi:F420-non-reducing hydrogenase large subunit